MTEIRARWEDSDSGCRLAPEPDNTRIRLTLTSPGVGSVWVVWDRDQAQAIRDGLTTWLGDDAA